jgi:hypothetical protein
VEATLLGRPHVFERGDKLYLTTPLVVASPTEQQIEEFAYASAVKVKAPNENIGWLSGRYVESGRANLNNAMWLSGELALKSLTPMLMPVTVMHDPRTAVGTIADCKLFNEEGQSARIDTILAIWRHRFPGVWDEAAQNIEHGRLMQSMECFTPHYECSECSQVYIKLPNGAEQASWCEHLRTNSGRRILGDVCFTGTGLIFGSRGGVGAYTDAYLDHFQDEIAEYHARAHVDSSYRPQRSAPLMGMTQIDENELTTLRQERNDAKHKVDELSETNRSLTTKVETAEAAQKKAESERDTEKAERTKLEESAARTSKAKGRLDALGAGFLGKLGDTSKAVLSELAGTASDDQWDLALREREELAGVKRDATGDSKPAPSSNESFSSEEVASFLGRVQQPASNGGGGAPAQDGAISVRQLARSFAKGKAGAQQ